LKSLEMRIWKEKKSSGIFKEKLEKLEKFENENFEREEKLRHIQGRKEKHEKFGKKRKAPAYPMEFVLHKWQLLEKGKDRALCKLSDFTVIKSSDAVFLGNRRKTGHSTQCQRCLLSVMIFVHKL